MKSNVLTIANKFSFRDVKDYEEKSDRFSSRGRQKLQLKQVLSLISFPLSLSYADRRGKMAGDSQIYLPRRVYSRRFRFPNGVRATSARNFQPRGDLSMQNGNLFRDILQYNDNAPISRQPSPPVTSYYSGLDIVNPQK